MQNDCAEFKIRAERKAGEFLAKTPKNNGAMGSGSNQYGVRLHDTTTPTLSELGIDKTQSYRWQQVASIPVETFEQHISDTKKKTAFCDARF